MLVVTLVAAVIVALLLRLLYWLDQRGDLEAEEDHELAGRTPAP